MILAMNAPGNTPFPGAKRTGTGSILVEHRGIMGVDASRGNLLKRAVW
ncbi:protein of unknown function [Candidatus Nitrotoga arctica]|uniref:Uncharacterized protein n=1 Tax=Candidatus Nitrotoga arctica TaxID=453162 RepID=A0ABM8Z0S9_9PROT|nr:protein of unknown function [Candidatus Nitrotoga arctica]